MRLSLLLLSGLLAAAPSARAATPDDLLRAYPDTLDHIDGNDLVWRDGTRMPLGIEPARDPNSMEHDATLRDQLRLPYPAGGPIMPPGPDQDPGRYRNRAFFEHLYGDCHAGDVAPHLVPVTWMENDWGHTLMVTSVEGVDQHLAAVSRELEMLPEEIRRYAYPSAGTFNCRDVAATGTVSMHSFAAAIDINTKYSDFWGWRGGDWNNRIPEQIVTIFEHHGFIWGGRWSHYDTMHFEYRPELLPYPPPADDGAAPAPLALHQRHTP